MAIPLRQSFAVGRYFAIQRLKRRQRFPIVLQLEPLYQCNLACAGCGKIQYPKPILQQRLTVRQCVDAVEECGAPIVSIAGGEPLAHREIDQIVNALIQRQRFVYLCTNGILMKRKLGLFKPSPYFSWSVHIDGLRERHDQSVCRPGIFDKAVDAIREAKRRGFRVSTNTTFFDTDDAPSIRAVLDFLNDDLGVDVMQISPGYAYEKAPDQEHFLAVERTRRLFRDAFAGGKREKWRLNHSPVFLDFLEGTIDLDCTPWGIPCYSVLGWQRPCYLMAEGGYTRTYQELLDETDWSQYGRGRHPKCANCMAHCGYEPSAVMVTARSLSESIRAFADTFKGQRAAHAEPSLPAV